MRLWCRMMLNRKFAAMLALFAVLGTLAVPGGPAPYMLLPIINQLVDSGPESRSATAREERHYDAPAE